MDCDVLIVGAGPAGSSAAYAAASGGAKTVFLDRKREIAEEEQFSGVVSAYLLPYLPFHMPWELIEHEVRGVRFVVEDVVFERRGRLWRSYAIDRPGFERFLAERAVDAGAELLLETEFHSIQQRGHEWRAVLRGGVRSAGFKVLIGADGALSQVLRSLGIGGARLGRAVVYEFGNLRLDAPDMDEIYFGGFAPGGYAHIFPISETRANIGVGSILEGVDLERCFKSFLSHPRVRSQMRGARKVREKSGVIVFERPRRALRHGQVLMAGEAAGQNIKPFVEGFLPSIICGHLAGRAAAGHVLRGEPLTGYERSVERKLGSVFRESEKLVGLIEEITEEKGGKSHILLAGLCGNVFLPGELPALRCAGLEGMRKRLLQRLSSRPRMAFTRVAEDLGLLYLQLLNLVNSKVYKL